MTNPTTPPLPSRSAIEKTMVGNMVCQEIVDRETCEKTSISCDVEVLLGKWIVFFTCEDGHRWYKNIEELPDKK